MTADSPPLRIGLALSGGGSRAIAFHLGCMEALHELNLLGRVDVISSVSGGSVLAGLFCAHDEAFDAFRLRTQKLLREGLESRIWRSAISLTGAVAFATFLWSALSALIITPIRWVAVWSASDWRTRNAQRQRFQFRGERRVTRTDLFENVLRCPDLCRDTMMDSLARTRPRLIVNAADLRTETAFRFAQNGAGTWRTGPVIGRRFRLSEAVAASAAYPLLLPAIDRSFRCKTKTGDADVRVLLSDGGIYDNLGVQAFDPTRPKHYAFAVENVDLIIASIAEPGLPDGDDLPLFWIGRVTKAFATVHRQLHRSGMSALHEWQSSGRIKAFIMPYLGQDDSKLPPVPDEPPPPALERLKNYPVNFAAMPSDVIDALVARGRAQTRCLVRAYLVPILAAEAA